MIRNISREYWKAYRWENLKQKGSFSGIFFLIYFLFILPMILGHFEDYRFEIIAPLAIPAFWIVISAALHPMRLPKLLFLCPMDQNERRKYVVTAFWYRMCLHTIFVIVGAVIMFLLKKDIISTVVVIFNGIILSFYCNGLNINGLGRTAMDGKRYLDLESKQGLNEGFGVVISIFLLYLYGEIIDSGGFLEQKLWELVVIGILIMIQLMLTIHYATYWNGAVERATNYEMVEQLSRRQEEYIKALKWRQP